MNSNDDKLTFEEKELAILRNAVDEITSRQEKNNEFTRSNRHNRNS